LIWRLAALGLLAGCAAFSPSASECRSMDWASRGYADGYGGHPPQDLRLSHQCARHGIAVAQADYLGGWAMGYDEHQRLKTLKCD
jgi:hypothetical protein